MITIEKSEELLNGLDIFYKAILPSEEHQRKKNLQIMATEEDSFHGKVSKPFLDYMKLKIVQDIRRSVIKAKTTPTIFTEFVDWEDISTKGKQLSKPAYVKILDKSGKQAAVIARVEAGFDVMNVNSIKWAEKYSAAMVTQVTNETKSALREVISDGMKQKWNKLKIARQINKMPIGLNLPQTKALHSFRDKLITDGASAKLVEKRVQSYYNKLLRQRSRSIARTETSRAVNEGYLQGLEQQNVYRRVRISMAADACHLCTEHEGRVFTLEEAHAFLPIHPFCRCAWVVVYSKRPSFMMPPLGLSDANLEQLQGEANLNNMMFDQDDILESAAMTKHKITEELYKKLKDSKDFMKYAQSRRLTVLWPDLTINAQTKSAVDSLVRQWAGTSGDASPQAIAMQMAARKEFGLSNITFKHFSEGLLKEARTILAKDGKALQAFLRAQYNLTQGYFKKQGVTSLTGYRGMTFTDMSAPSNLAFKPQLAIVQDKLQLQPISSFTTDMKTATDFVFAKADNSMFIQSKVPIERILSTCQTGFGCKKEAEFVILGGKESFKITTFNIPLRTPLPTVNELYQTFADFKVVPK